MGRPEQRRVERAWSWSQKSGEERVSKERREQQSHPLPRGQYSETGKVCVVRGKNEVLGESSFLGRMKPSRGGD